MKKSLRKFVILAVVLPVFLGCPNVFDSNDAGNRTGIGSFSLTIKGVERTILPSAPPEFAAYKLEFTSVVPAGEEPLTPVTMERTPTESGILDAVLLASGTWNLTVTAYKDTARVQPVARGTLSGILIGTSPVSGSVTLKPIVVDGKGNYKWSITLADGVTYASMMITPISADETLGGQEKILRDTESPDTPDLLDSSLELYSGYYNVVFYLDKEGSQYFLWKEILHIYENQESVFTFNFSEELFNASIYTITYMYDETTVRYETYIHNGKADSPELIPRPGYTFGGWYTDVDMTEEYDFDTLVTGDLILYAKWISHTYSGSDLNKLAEWLSSKPANNADTPYTLTMTGDFNLGTMPDSAWHSLLAAINTAGRFVDLDISACTITGTEFNHNNQTMVSGMDKLAGISLPEGVTSISDRAFENCTGLKGITLPSNLTEIGSYVFKGCTSLTNITLPSGLDWIHDGAFMGCTSLAAVTLPASVTKIGERAFNGCVNLKLFTCLMEEPSTLGSYALDNTHQDLQIKVPAANVDAYKAKEGWNSPIAEKISAIQ